MLQTYTGYSLMWTAVGFLFPHPPIFLQKVVGVNMIATCFAALLHSVRHYSHPTHSMLMRSFYFHVIPIFPGVLWYRHAEKITRDHFDLFPTIRIIANLVLFAIWVFIPYKRQIGLQKINDMYHNPDWWISLILAAGWIIFHMGLGKTGSPSLPRRRTDRLPTDMESAMSNTD